MSNLPFRYSGYIFVTKEGKINLLDAIKGESLVRSSLLENISSGYYLGRINLDPLGTNERTSASYLFSQAKFRE